MSALIFAFGTGAIIFIKHAANIARIKNGEEKPEIKLTGEEGVHQMCALLGLGDIVTNVNIPNYGQIPNLPIGAVVETNAVFSADSVKPVFAGNVPESIYPLVSKITRLFSIICRCESL